MSRTDNLKAFEIVLESFLERAVAAKEKRLQVAQGINRLEQIDSRMTSGVDPVDRLGEWFADHNRWLEQENLKHSDIDRIGRILDNIRNELDLENDESPASRKISSEIDRWQLASPQSTQSLVLKRGPEAAAEGDTVADFRKLIPNIGQLFEQYAVSKLHIMSVLDETLRTAELQKNKEALILSAFIIYYLKTGGYKVDPYVMRLKQAEKALEEDDSDA